ncbi:MAG TPA: YdcH family protein [Thermoanaerobaculia bacterium]|jgi:uncharacterized protein YdcH (DUF465 family)|nr:YdcH family protein [Thermoanaerobaculia bacterium]
MVGHDLPTELTHDERYQELQRQHQEHERLLHQFAEKGHLTEEEDFEEKRLKKEKLALKDQMEAILRRYRETATA